MNTKKIIRIISIAGLVVLVQPQCSMAASSVNTSATRGGHAATNPAMTLVKTAADISTVITRSDTAIDAKMAALADFQSRMGSMKNLDVTTKTTLQAEIQTNISGLTDLRAKIDAETDLPSAQNDEKIITGGFPIYDLLIPQGWILAASDRVGITASMMATIGTKLQTRLKTEESAGNDITALEMSLTDVNTKITDAQAQSSAAITIVSGLKADGGDKTIATANAASLKTAKVDIQTAIVDLQNAELSMKTIMTAVQSFESADSQNSARAQAPAPTTMPTQNPVSAPLAPTTQMQVIPPTQGPIAPTTPASSPTPNL